MRKPVISRTTNKYMGAFEESAMHSAPNKPTIWYGLIEIMILLPFENTSIVFSHVFSAQWKNRLMVNYKF